MNFPVAYSEEERRLLIQLARDAITHYLQEGELVAVKPANYPEKLRELRASFVTLKIHGALRGCIGSLEARQPLVQDVALNAIAAATRDPRFPALQTQELAATTISLSILSPTEPIEFSSEQDLLAKIRPGIDGLILQDGFYRGTFLPVMWEELPTPEEFLKHLKLKAGLKPHYWSDSLEVWRYTAESFGEEGED